MVYVRFCNATLDKGTKRTIERSSDTGKPTGVNGVVTHE